MKRTPRARVVLSQTGEVLGAGKTLRDALREARTFQAEAIDERPCPRCGWTSIDEREWMAFAIDQNSLEMLQCGGGYDDFCEAFTWDPDREHVVWLHPAECVFCHADACQECSVGWVQREGVETQLPPASAARWRGKKGGLPK